MMRELQLQHGEFQSPVRVSDNSSFAILGITLLAFPAPLRSFPHDSIRCLYVFKARLKCFWETYTHTRRDPLILISALDKEGVLLPSCHKAPRPLISPRSI